MTGRAVSKKGPAQLITTPAPASAASSEAGSATATTRRAFTGVEAATSSRRAGSRPDQDRRQASRQKLSDDETPGMARRSDDGDRRQFPAHGFSAPTDQRLRGPRDRYSLGEPLCESYPNARKPTSTGLPRKNDSRSKSYEGSEAVTGAAAAVIGALMRCPSEDSTSTLQRPQPSGQPLIRLALVWALAPQGQRHVAWGASPRKEGQDESEPRRGDGSLPRTMACRRPFGAQDCMRTELTWGLTPQATCLRPLRGKLQEARLYRVQHPFRISRSLKPKRQQRRDPDPGSPSPARAIQEISRPSLPRRQPSCA